MRVRRGLVAALVAFLAGLALAQDQDAAECQGVLVSTTGGLVCGGRVERNGVAINTWLGIPYAQPPVGELRWSNPLPVEPWEGTRQATVPGHICPQPPNPLRTAAAPEPALQSEDCLFANIWAPASRQDELLPVLVYIHGGAFTHGSSTDSPMPTGEWYLHDGSFLAGQGIVVASFNYRLGALGFLANAGATGLRGNFGFRDQLLALTWLHDNLTAFGGDPDRITLAGESAGAMSVGLHLLSSPASRDLFKQAIMQSNPLGVTYRTLEQARLTGDSFLLSSGCLLSFDQLACLRDLEVEQILEAQQGWQLTLNVLQDGLQGVLAWSPVIDDALLLEQPLKAAVRDGSSKPLLIGYTADEGLLFVAYAIAEPLNRFLYSSALDLLYGSSTQQPLVELYPLEEGGDGREPLSAVVNDSVFVCPALAMATVSQPLTSFVYRFSHEPSFDLDNAVTQCRGRSCHATELSFVFGSGNFVGGFTEDESELARQMGAYWHSFTSKGGTAEAMAPWPAWDRQQRQLLDFRVPNSIATAAGHNCELWLEWAEQL